MSKTSGAKLVSRGTNSVVYSVSNLIIVNVPGI